MAENSISNSIASSQHPKTAGGGGGGGGGVLHHNKSLDMTSSSTGGGSGPTTGKNPGGKHANVIHRTTSESLRLGGGGGAGTPGSTTGGGGSSVSGGGGGENSVSSTGSPASMMNSSASVNSISRKGGAGPGSAAAAAVAAASKASSFMITSVTVGARTSADNGDDSADDLDESHTDDNSRITDFENETPSFSEDTFSKEDVFFAANALGSVPVIPTSSQYGLAIVAPSDRGHGAEALADAMHVSVTDAGINIMGHAKDDGKDLHHRNERFKVVKIESTEPFKRGRWVCMDYLDHTTLQASPKEGGSGPVGEGETSTASTIVDSNAIRTQDSGVVLNDNYAGTTAPTTTTSEAGDNAEYHTHLAASVATNPIIGLLNNESPGQSLNLTQQAAAATGGAGAVTQSQQSTSHTQSSAAGGVPHSLPQTQLQNALAGAAGAAGTGSQPAPSTQSQGQSQYYPHTMSNMADITQQQQTPHQHGVTLPSNIQMQPQQQQQQQPQPNASSAASVVSSSVLPPVGSASATSQEMNIVINNPQHQPQPASFPSPQQFQQQPSQTNSPVVASIGEPTQQIASSETAILSPSSSMASSSVTNTTATVASSVPSQQPAEPVSAVDPLISATPSATSSPITATASGDVGSSAVPVPQSSSSAAAAGSTPTSAAAPTAASSPSTAVNTSTAAAAATTTSSSSSLPSSQHASIAAAAAAAAATATSDHLSESNLLSAVAGVTAAAVAAAGAEDGEKTGEDGESLGRIQPVATTESTLGPNESTSAERNPPLPATTSTTMTMTTSSLQKHLQQNMPLDRSRFPSSSTTSVSVKANTFTDLALGKTIQDLMRPSSTSSGGAGSTRPVKDGVFPSDQYGGESLCRTACNFLNSGAHSIATCTTSYPHRCVKDLIKEELGSGGGAGGSASMSRGGGPSGTLSNAGSLVNIHIESELQQHGGIGGGIGAGFQSHPGSGRSSPAHQMFHQGSPPKHLGAIGHSISIPSSARVSRAPSPSFLHAAVGDHSSASGTSAVAIDNKIEQAMDLVKSHLMFAVREEVEVLKEKISELMDRINQLEYENNILKQNASQETLSQLTPTGTQPSSGGNSGSTAAAAATAAVAAAAAAAAAVSTAASLPNPNSNGSVS